MSDDNTGGPVFPVRYITSTWEKHGNGPWRRIPDAMLEARKS